MEQVLFQVFSLVVVFIIGWNASSLLRRYRDSKKVYVENLYAYSNAVVEVICDNMTFLKMGIVQLVLNYLFLSEPKVSIPFSKTMILVNRIVQPMPEEDI